MKTNAKTGRPVQVPRAVELRAITSSSPPERSTVIGVTFVVADYLVLSTAAAVVISAPWWIAKVLGVLAAGIAVAMLFALAHDAAHGSLAESRWANRLLATICFLPSWYPFTPWIRGHNHLHHGWTNVAECDYSWRPVSPDAYRGMSSGRRVLERAYRAWWGLWLHSIVEIWWKHMAMPRASDRQFLRAGQLHADRAIVAGAIAAHTVFCLLVAPRWSTVAGGPAMSGLVLVIMLVLVPWWTFHVLFSVVTFLHHTHPRVPWFRTRGESNFFIGQVRATVHVTLPRWLTLLLHNITVHGAHHVDPRVPFRHLPTAQQRLADAFADDVIVETWSLKRFIATARMCQLYDYDTHEWCTFASVRPLPRPAGEPLANVADRGVKEIVA